METELIGSASGTISYQAMTDAPRVPSEYPPRLRRPRPTAGSYREDPNEEHISLIAGCLCASEIDALEDNACHARTAEPRRPLALTITEIRAFGTVVPFVRRRRGLTSRRRFMSA